MGNVRAVTLNPLFAAKDHLNRAFLAGKNALHSRVSETAGAFLSFAKEGNSLLHQVPFAPDHRDGF